MIGSTYRNLDLNFRKEWFRIKDPAVVALSKEAANARNLNTSLLTGIDDLNLKNLVFIDPLEAIGKSCVKNVDSYRKCFSDESHISKKSAQKIMIHFLEKYFPK